MNSDTSPRTCSVALGLLLFYEIHSTSFMLKKKTCSFSRVSWAMLASTPPLFVKCSKPSTP